MCGVCGVCGVCASYSTLLLSIDEYCWSAAETSFCWTYTAMCPKCAAAVCSSNVHLTQDNDIYRDKMILPCHDHDSILIWLTLRLTPSPMGVLNSKRNVWYVDIMRIAPATLCKVTPNIQQVCMVQMKSSVPSSI